MISIDTIAERLFNSTHDKGYLSKQDINDVVTDLLVLATMILTEGQVEKLTNCVRRYKNSGESLSAISKEIYDVVFHRCDNTAHCNSDIWSCKNGVYLEEDFALLPIFDPEQMISERKKYNTNLIQLIEEDPFFKRWKHC